MSDDFQIGLLLLILFQVKHTLADFFLQTSRMLTNRSLYAHMGRVQHAGIHAVLTLGCVLLAGLPVVVALALFAIDAVVHFHIDWIKGSHSERSGDTPEAKRYWVAFGLDQLAHQLTYVGLIWLAVAMT